MNIQKNIQGIVLAAGYSRRFGVEKTLISIDALPMAIKSALSLKSVVKNILMIVNENNIALQKIADKYEIKYIINKTEANSGIGSSLSLAVKSSLQAEGWMFCLGDMPFIKTCTYKMVLKALNEGHADSIVIPRFNGKSGHPVGFGKSFQKLLMRKTGDTGARTIIKGYSGNIIHIETDDSGVISDIDTQSDLI